MKNLKIYERLMRKDKSKVKKKHKFKLAIVSLVLAATTLSACSIMPGHQKDYSYQVGTPSSSYTETAESETSEIEEMIDKIVADYNSKDLADYTKAIINSQLTLPSSSVQSFSAQVSSMPTEYVYSNLYNVEAAYQRYLALNQEDGKIYPILSTGRVDASELYKLVLENNIAYKEANRYSIHTKLDDSYIKQYCDIVASTVNALLDDGWEVNLADLSYNLQNLCMFKSATGSNAFVSNDGCLVVQPSNLDMMKAISNNEQAEKITISHETVHLIQKLSYNRQDELGLNMAYGFSYSFKDLEVNSLFNKWYQEATAETAAASVYNSNPTVYEAMIGYLNSLRFVHGMRADFRADDMERISVNGDWNEVFKVFNCTTEEEKIELLKVFFSINIIQQQPEDFMTLYENKVLGHEMSEDELIQLQVELKVGICRYLTKQFYTNLSERIANKQVKVEDVFELISTLESSLNTHIKYTEEDRLETIKPFLDEYQSIQSMFFKMMSDAMNISQADLENAYNEFNGQMEVKTDSILRETVYEQIDIPWLDEGMQKAVQNKHEETSGKKTISINEYLNIQQNNKIY